MAAGSTGLGSTDLNQSWRASPTPARLEANNFLEGIISYPHHCLVGQDRKVSDPFGPLSDGVNCSCWFG